MSRRATLKRWAMLGAVPGVIAGAMARLFMYAQSGRTQAIIPDLISVSLVGGVFGFLVGIVTLAINSITQKNGRPEKTRDLVE